MLTRTADILHVADGSPMRQVRAWIATAPAGPLQRGELSLSELPADEVEIEVEAFAL